MRRSPVSIRSTSRLATCSRARFVRRPVSGLGRLAVAALLVVSMASVPAAAKVLLSQDEALGLAFPGDSAKERRTAYLTDDQVSRIRALGGSEPASRVVVYYVGAADANRPAAAAYFDTHLVRTLPETIMVVVDPDSKVRRVDILSFEEPEEYLPRPRFIEQFTGRPLDDEMSTSRGIRAVTGATLSSRAITAAVRRILAIHAVLAPAPPPARSGERR